MRQLSKRDFLVVGCFAALAVVTVGVAIAGEMKVAIAALALLIATVGIISRIEFVTRRASLQTQLKETRNGRRALERTIEASHPIASTLADVRQQLDSLTQRTGIADRKQDESMSANSSAFAQLDLVVNQLLSESRRATEESRRAVADLHADVARLAASVELASADSNRLQQAQKRLLEAVAALRTQVRMQGYTVINDMQGLAQLLARYTPKTPLPLMSGWALGPGGLVYLLHVIERDDVQVAVECGSGTSTLWMALAMREKGSGKVISLEHSEEYARRTRAALEEHDLTEWADVRVCPLVATPTPRGEFQWYDVERAELPKKLDLVLVDGPPGATGPHARYPAGPLLGSRVRPGGLIVMDDADRPDERETVGFWLQSEPLVQLPSPDRGVAVLIVREQDVA